MTSMNSHQSMSSNAGTVTTVSSNSTTCTSASAASNNPASRTGNTKVKVELKDLYQPFTTDEIAKAQSTDEKLKRFLENPGQDPLYPKFTMSIVKQTDKPNIYLFRKRVYVPRELRQATMEHYFKKYDKSEEWTTILCRHKIWPTIDTDITDFASTKKKSG